MKIVAKPIQMVAWFEEDGSPHPIKFRLLNEEQCWSTVKIDKVIIVEREKLAGNPMHVFQCQSLINNVLKTYELKYELNTCKWMLFKM